MAGLAPGVVATISLVTSAFLLLFLFLFCRYYVLRDSSEDSEALLPRQDADPHTSPFQKFAEVLAALNTGKYPSQDQIGRALQILLKSSALSLNAPTEVLGARPGSSLSVSGRRLIEHAREIIEAVLRIGLEKNSDDIIQRCLHALAGSNVASPAFHAELNLSSNPDGGMGAIASELPSSEELTSDTVELLACIKQVSQLLLTSAVFRIILSDIITTAQEIAAAAAVEVQTFASQVELGAGEVEHAVRAGNMSLDDAKAQFEQTKEDVLNLAEQKREHLTEVQTEAAVKLKYTVLSRIQQLIVTARENPKHRRALQTIISLIRKHAHKLQAASTTAADLDVDTRAAVRPTINTDPRLRHALSLLQQILERFASGHSLDPVLLVGYQVVLDVINLPVEADAGVKVFLRDLGRWLDQALAEDEFSTSWNGGRTLEQLYDRGGTLLADESNSSLREACTSLLQELQKFVEALQSDRSTRRLINAIDGISSDVSDFGRTAAKSTVKETRRRRDEFKRDALAWLLPRILAAIHVLPLPRVEYMDSLLDVAVDSVLLTSGSSTTSLLPDHVQIDNWSELRLDTLEVQAHPGHGETSYGTMNKFHIHLDGVRLFAERIGYYLRYKGLLGYEDQGLLSVGAGHSDAEGQGLSMDIQLDMESLEEEEVLEGSVESLFRVANVAVDVPGLHFAIDKSRHWVLNKLILQPFSGPVVRKIASSVLQEQVRGALDALGQILFNVRRRAQEHARQVDQETPSLDHYWYGLLESSGISEDILDDEDIDDETLEGEDDQPDVTMETNLNLTTKGIVRKTVTYAEPDASSPSTPEEAIIAVGVGPQVVQGVAGAYGEEEPIQGLAKVMDDVGEGIEQAKVKSAEIARDATEEVEDLRDDATRAQSKMKEREHVERRRRGWRSTAFDF